MLGSVILLTAIYWLSDLVVALWLGGLLMVSLVFTLPLDLLPEGASPAALAVGVSTSVRMIDRLRPFAAAASVVLIASVVLSVILERQGRHSFGWWVIWFVRSLAAVAMVAVALYSFGDMDSLIVRLEADISSLTAPSMTGAGADTLARAIRGEPTAETVRASFHELDERYTGWMWVELALGSIVLLAAAIKQAVWRRSWVADHMRVPPAAEGKPPEEKPPETTQADT